MNKDHLNPYFQELDVDYLYHLGLDSSMDLPKIFGDVEYVILTRSFNNAELVANEFVKKFYKIKDVNIKCMTIGKNERFHIHKVHNSLIVSHGIGVPSLLICLNEIVKLLWHSKVENPKFFRTGPADGLGVPPGSIVLGTSALDNAFKSEFVSIEFGETYIYPAPLDTEFTQDVAKFARSYQPILGQIIGGVGYYTGQARLNGSMPLTYTPEEQSAYLDKAYNLGVRSLDMEVLGFAAFCQQLAIPGCEVNSILVDRFKSDQISLPKKEQLAILTRTAHLIIDYVIHN